MVTALHGVADCGKIRAENDEGLALEDLKIDQLDIDRDVALLSVPDLESLSLEELVIETDFSGLFDNELYVVGYPLNLGTQLPTELQRRGRTISLLDLIPADIALLKPLNERNSPDVNIQVISIEGHLLPGHSGAPIFNRTHKVIGISNGGLELGTVEISWGILWPEIEWKPVSEDEKRFEELKRNNPLLFSFSTNQSRIILTPKEACDTAIRAESMEALKRSLLNQAKQKAADEFLSSDYVRVDLSIYPRIRLLATEYVRITGSERYYNDEKNLAQVCVEIAPYFSEEAKKQLRPLLLTERACVAVDDEQSYTKLQEEAKNKAILQALEKHNPDLVRLGKEQMLSLMRSRDFDIEPQEQQFCVTVTGEILPLEALALLNLLPTPTPTPTPTDTNTPQPTPTPTFTQTPLPTASQTPTPSNTLPPTAIPTLIQTPTDASEPTSSPAPTSTPDLMATIEAGIATQTRLAALVQAAPTLTLTPTGTPVAKSAPSEEKIAFISERDGKSEIYFMDVDGSDVTRITDNPLSRYESVTWSPDGSQLAATLTNTFGQRTIIVMNADGNNRKVLTNNRTNNYLPAWSLDGEKIAFVSDRDGSEKIYVMNVDGSNQINLTADTAGNQTSPTWSPDGQQIAYSTDQRQSVWQIHVMNADGSNQKRLTHTISTKHSPVWSLDGKYIAYIQTFIADRIYIMDTDGSNPTLITENIFIEDQLKDSALTWSPDGKNIAYVADQDGQQDIYRVSLEGREPIRLTDNEANDFSPAWSPR